MGLAHLGLFYATLGCFCGSLITASFKHYINTLIQVTGAMHMAFFLIFKDYVGGWFSLIVCQSL